MVLSGWNTQDQLWEYDFPAMHYIYFQLSTAFYTNFLPIDFYFTGQEQVGVLSLGT